MCEFCEKEDVKPPLPFPRSFRGFNFPGAGGGVSEGQGEPEAAQASPEEKFSEAARDVLGMLRVSQRLGVAETVTPAQLKFVCALLGVSSAELAQINRIMEPLAKQSKRSPEDVIADAFMNLMGM